MKEKKAYEAPSVRTYKLEEILSTLGPAHANVYGTEGGPPDIG